MKKNQQITQKNQKASWRGRNEQITQINPQITQKNWSWHGKHWTYYLNNSKNIEALYERLKIQNELWSDKIVQCDNKKWNEKELVSK